MAVTITQRPIKDGTAWNGALSPIVYKFLVLSDDWDNIRNEGGNVKLNKLASTGPGGYSEGDLVYVSSDDYNFTAKVISFNVTDAGGGNNFYELVVDEPYVADDDDNVNSSNFFGGGYKLLVWLRDLDDERINQEPFEYYPLIPPGEFVVDVSSIIRSALSPNNEFNYIDADVSKGFYIEYREDYFGNTDTNTNDDDSNPIWAILGALQVPNVNGGNYKVYDSDNAGFKLLTKLTRPKLWRGYPWFISSIFNTVDDFEFEFVINSVAKQTTVSNNAGNVMQADPQPLYTPEEIKAADTMTVQAIAVAASEIITVDLLDPCENAIMLIGRNSLGGALCWLFDYSQDWSFTYDNGKKAQRKTLYAIGLTANEWECLHDFFGVGDVYRENIIEFTEDTIATSRRVGSQVYMVDQAGNETGVIVIPTVNRTKTRLRSHIFELTIELPESF
jgi:hypothetical protein